MAARHGKPCLIIDASDSGSLAEAAAALREMEGDISLNVAGQRESGAPGSTLRPGGSWKRCWTASKAETRPMQAQKNRPAETGRLSFH